MTIELPPAFSSAQEAVSYLEQSIERCEVSRVACDILVPLGGTALADQQRRNYHSFLLLHGAALGILVTLMRTKISGEPVLSDAQYMRYRTRVQATLTANITGGILQ
jgi:hypothetical protein